MQIATINLMHILDACSHMFPLKSTEDAVDARNAVLSYMVSRDAFRKTHVHVVQEVYEQLEKLVDYIELNKEEQPPTLPGAA